MAIMAWTALEKRHSNLGVFGIIEAFNKLIKIKCKKRAKFTDTTCKITKLVDCITQPGISNESKLKVIFMTLACKDNLGNVYDYAADQYSIATTTYSFTVAKLEERLNVQCTFNKVKASKATDQETVLIVGTAKPKFKPKPKKKGSGLPPTRNNSACPKDANQWCGIHKSVWHNWNSCLEGECYSLSRAQADAKKQLDRREKDCNGKGRFTWKDPSGKAHHMEPCNDGSRNAHLDNTIPKANIVSSALFSTLSNLLATDLGYI
ncbi:hypothetical protein BDV98DRAFT_587261 [Pterulicium gracile]|uniref:Uncharacterized protein n=1 Tax=Pterulicium gracile TaxID=1884261 RepID=A0A5C3PZW3_9AGAR|nr:hypothetical protein BDV98DRAFT_587261 [Pterula gracilis]